MRGGLPLPGDLRCPSGSLLKTRVFERPTELSGMGSYAARMNCVAIQVSARYRIDKWVLRDRSASLPRTTQGETMTVETKVARHYTLSAVIVLGLALFGITAGSTARAA